MSILKCIASGDAHQWPNQLPKASSCGGQKKLLFENNMLVSKYWQTLLRLRVNSIHLNWPLASSSSRCSCCKTCGRRVRGKKHTSQMPLGCQLGLQRTSDHSPCLQPKPEIDIVTDWKAATIERQRRMSRSWAKHLGSHCWPTQSQRCPLSSARAGA